MMQNYHFSSDCLLEEICTLVIAETFPEDAGIFACRASNDYGSVTSTAKLTVLSGIQQFLMDCVVYNINETE